MAQGGEAAGCAASSFIGQFVAGYRRPLKSLLFDAIAAANREVFRRFRGNGGTTLTAIIVTGSGDAWSVHVGDSRLYECGPNRTLNLLTRDDTIGGQLRPTADEDILDNRLLQFVGVGSQIEPHIARVANSVGSTFLLTSDGAHSIGKRVLEGIAKNSGTAAELIRKVVFVAEAIGVEDNSSAVSISVAELNPLPTFSSGIELTVWSPSDKLEMWLGLSPGLPSDSYQSAQPRVSSPPKQKKAGRARSKAPKKGENAPNESEQDSGKPQLNIEFGSKNKDHS